MTRRLLAAGLALAAAVVLAAPATPARAQTTKPPVPAELAGLPQIEVTYGQSITLQFSGDAPDFEHPVSCGELGCVYNSIAWGLPPGSNPTAGCTSTSTSCTFSYTPPGFGGNGEAWKKATVAHMQGSFTISSTSYAILGTVGKYTTYPDLWFNNGDPDQFASGRRIYLVRGGTTPDVSTCSSDLGDPQSQAIPDCLVIAGSSGARNLPEGSSWTVYGSLTGGGTGQVSQQPGTAGFSTTSFTVNGDNILLARVTHVARPTLAVTVTDVPTTIGLNQTATVHVTVSAVGGQGGQITNITFPRGILTSGGSTLETALQIVSPASPPAPFTLSSGQSQTFDVTIKGVEVRNNVFVGSHATGTTDEAQGRTQTSSSSKTNVADGPPPPPDDPDDAGDAPPPPVITSAFGGAPGTVAGTASGVPHATVQVKLVSAAASASCPRLMSGAGIASVGTLTVAIPSSGTAAFSYPAPVAPNSWTYGTTVAGSKTSDVSSCRRVGQAPSTVALALAKKKIKAGRRGKATVTVTASGLSPTGTVTIREGSKVVGTAQLTAGDHGKVKVRLSKRPKGKHTLTATYAGSSDVASATSTAVVLTVKD